MIGAALLLTPCLPPRVFAQTAYFEEPRAIVSGELRYPRFVSYDDELLIIHQEVAERTGRGGQLYLTVERSPQGRRWRSSSRVVGPIPSRERMSPNSSPLCVAGGSRCTWR